MAAIAKGSVNNIGTMKGILTEVMIHKISETE